LIFENFCLFSLKNTPSVSGVLRLMALKAVGRVDSRAYYSYTKAIFLLNFQLI
jgi:hypothetical protein